MRKLMISLLLSVLSGAALADVAVIVNPANTAAISESEIQNLFLGKTASFGNGTKAKPYNLGENGVREVFDKQALGRSTSQVQAYWSKLVFTGKGTPPDELAASADAVAAVAKQENAIAYVDSAAVNGSVKVVATYKP